MSDRWGLTFVGLLLVFLLSSCLLESLSCCLCVSLDDSLSADCICSAPIDRSVFLLQRLWNCLPACLPAGLRTYQPGYLPVRLPACMPLSCPSFSYPLQSLLISRFITGKGTASGMVVTTAKFTLCSYFGVALG